jgi:hypothetical protein
VAASASGDAFAAAPLPNSAWHGSGARSKPVKSKNVSFMLGLVIFGSSGDDHERGGVLEKICRSPVKITKHVYYERNDFVKRMTTLGLV